MVREISIELIIEQDGEMWSEFGTSKKSGLIDQLNQIVIAKAVPDKEKRPESKQFA